MSKPGNHITLEASFDIEQLASNLDWNFVCDDGTVNPSRGKYANSISFKAGQTLSVQVKAASRSHIEVFEIIDCCMVTVSQLTQLNEGQGKFPPPSPWQLPDGTLVPGASFAIPPGDFKEVPVDRPIVGYEQRERRWDGNLVVASTGGRWELSFVITVNVVNADGPQKRVFVFDPECETFPGY